MEKEDKCYYCNKPAIAERRICVDVDVEHDIDPDTGKTIWRNHPLFSNVGVCADHMEDDGDIKEDKE